MDLALYIHVPFCVRRCTYCDFVTYADRPTLLTPYAAALLTELHQQAATLLARHPTASATTLYFGGGTPSLLPPAAIAALIEAAREDLHLSPAAEITLEANPGTVQVEQLSALRRAGVNRLSLGVQSADAGELRLLGRIHTWEEAARTVAAARQAGFDNLNLDLIFGLPGQTLTPWQHTLEATLALAPEHLSLYALTLEPGTPLAEAVARGAVPEPDPDLAADLYDLTQEMTAAAGLPSYEISNHAKAGDESRHNLLYWRYGEYAGVGPGAHSRLAEGSNRIALIAEKHPETWRSLVTAQGHGIVSEEIVAAEAQAREMMLMGLRITEGIDLAAHARLSNRPIAPEKIAALSELGLVTQEKTRLRATEAGRRILNAVIAELAE